VTAPYGRLNPCFACVTPCIHLFREQYCWRLLGTKIQEEKEVLSFMVDDLQRVLHMPNTSSKRQQMQQHYIMTR
jgi:hypothetical protein